MGQEHKSLKDFLGEQNTSKTFEEILEIDKKEELEEKQQEKRDRQRFRKWYRTKGFWLHPIIIGILLTSSLVAFLFTNDEKAIPKNPAPPADVVVSKSDDPWYIKNPDSVIAIKIDTWLTNPETIQANKLNRNQAEYFFKKFSNSNLESVVNTTLVREVNGFTSNKDNAFLENGTPNPKYSYITAERFLIETGIITEKLLNPYWGGWGHFQYSESNANTAFTTNIFSQIFTQEYMNQYFSGPDYSILPILADWQGNDFGLKDTLIPYPGKGRWIGEITNSSINFIDSQNTTDVKAKAIYTVKFSALDMEKRVLTKTGTLILDYTTVNDAINDPTRLRVLVSGGSLTID